MLKKRGEGKNAVLTFLRDCRLQYSLILMVLPGMVIVFLFNYLPMYGIVIAFKDYNPVAGISASPWVGLKYFELFFSNPMWPRLIRNTFQLGLYALLWGFPAPIILALLFDQLQLARFKKTMQTISYLPYFISAVVMVGMLKELTAINGVFNSILAYFNIAPISFMTDPGWFRTLFIGSGIWQGVGWGSIIYLAALSNVDPQLIEASVIDGANRFQRVLYISWPAILPTTTILLIFACSSILGSDAQKVLLMYNDATYSTADIIGTYTYREGIVGGRFEFSTAIGLMMNVVSCALLIIANTISRSVSENSLW